MSMANRAVNAESRRQDGLLAVVAPNDPSESPDKLQAPSVHSSADTRKVRPHSDGRGVPDDWFVDPIHLGVPGVRAHAAPAIAFVPSAVPVVETVRERPIAAEPADEELLAWQSDSLCAQTDPEAFFPEKGGSTRDAKKICGSCEVRAQCLEYALQNDERFGIWGGLSERERRKLRKRA